MKLNHAFVIAAMIQLAVLAGAAKAAVIYDYESSTFFQEVGSTFTTNDKITGFVELGTPATINQIGKSDVVAFSFTASASGMNSLGPVTLDNNSDADTGFIFDFDASLNIVRWGVTVRARTEPFPNPAITTCKNNPNGITQDGKPYCFSVQEVILGSASVNTFFTEAASGAPGGWTKRIVAMSSPASLHLSIVGLAALAFLRRRSRAHGLHSPFRAAAPSEANA